MAAKRLQTGTNINKATKHWKLAKATENIAELVTGMKGLIFQTIRRKANGIADHLANCGADNPNIAMDRGWWEMDDPIIREACKQLAEKDLIQATQP